jgi:actin-related protein
VDYNNNLIDKFSIYVSTSHKLKFINLADKINTVWYGGSLLTSLGTFQPMWVTR